MKDVNGNIELKKEFEKIIKKDITEDSENVKRIGDITFQAIFKNFTENLIKIRKNCSTEYDKTQGYKIGNFDDNFSITAENGIMFVGDIHADAKSLKWIWYIFDKLKQQNAVDKIVFLGDYGDRGPYWVYTYFLLAAMTDYYSKAETTKTKK